MYSSLDIQYTIYLNLNIRYIQYTYRISIYTQNGS